ncbi:MAG: SidE phosphodiesterase domain-containing protein [Bdellovibrionales bacterium]
MRFRLQIIIILLAACTTARAETDAATQIFGAANRAILPNATAGTCVLGSDNLYRKVTPANGCPTPVIPFSTAMKTAGCPKRLDYKDVQAAQKKYESYLDPGMLKAADEYLSKPYPKAPGETRTMHGVTVNRPNHGIAHAARTATLTKDIVDTVLNGPDNSLKTWLHEKMDNDASFAKKLSLMVLFHRSGRVDEGNDLGTDKRTGEVTNAANYFEKAISKTGLCFTPDEVNDFKQAIILDGKPNDNVDQTNLERLLRGAHLMDLIRLGWKNNADIQKQLPELTQDDIAKLYKRENGYMATTGYNLGKGPYSPSVGRYTQKFFDLSNDPDALSRALIDAQGSQ